jgi:hypothetical protein
MIPDPQALLPERQASPKQGTRRKRFCANPILAMKISARQLPLRKLCHDPSKQATKAEAATHNLNARKIWKQHLKRGALPRTIFAEPMREGKTMLYSSRRNRKTKAIAEVLAMIASARQLAPHRLDATADAEESLYGSATEFCAALEQYAAHAAQLRKVNH